MVPKFADAPFPYFLVVSAAAVVLQRCGAVTAGARVDDLQDILRVDIQRSPAVTRESH